MVGVRPRKGRFLEDGPHTVIVTPMKPVDGRAGRRYEPQTPVTIDRVLVQPSAGNALKAAETRTPWKGLVDEGTIRVIGTARTWPGGPHSLIRVTVGPPGIQGHLYQQSGDAQNYGASPMTRHFTVRGDSATTESK